MWFTRWSTRLQHFLKDDDDATTSVEYAVMLALIVVVCIVSLRALGDNQTGMWGKTVQELDDVGF